jgi:hypothetical protein
MQLILKDTQIVLGETKEPLLESMSMKTPRVPGILPSSQERPTKSGKKRRGAAKSWGVVVVRVMWKRTVRACLMVFSTLMRTRIFLRMRMMITPTLMLLRCW